MRHHLRRLAVRLPLVAVLLLVPGVARAQPTFESAGERALGMGGAFVAVADDATATHWNPAGLAGAGPGGMTIGWYRFQSGNPDLAPAPGLGKRSGTLTSLGTYPLGISYGRFEMTNIIPNLGDGVGVRTLRTNQYAATVLQSVVQGLIVGSTIRYMRGDVVTTSADDATLGAALDSTKNLRGRRTGTLDLDLGVMADMQQLRIGVTFKNLTTPTFGDPALGEMTLPRQTRLGVAVLPTDGLTLAMDVDLDTVGLQGDLRRMLALGGESRLSQRLAVRSGVRWSLKGDRRLMGSAGLSISVRKGLWLDGHYSQSHLDEVREFGVALRAGL